MLYAKAITLANYANIGDAISTFDKVNKYNPSFHTSMHFKATAYLRIWQAGDQQVATIAFEKLWTIAPSYVQSKCMVGWLYEKLLDQNRQILERCIADKKSRDSSRYMRKMIFQR